MAVIWRRPIATVAVLASVLVLALAGCGSSSTSSNGSSASSAGGSGSGQVHFAKTKFVLHAGLAFGVFHRYIYKPAKAGDFSHPFSHKLKLFKAALAAAFVYHELKLALHDAQSSKILSKLVAPITALQARIHGLGGELHGGTPSAASLNQDNSAIDAIKSQAAQSGQPITEQSTSHF
jgi:hypothetical protein